MYYVYLTTGNVIGYITGNVSKTRKAKMKGR